MLQNYHISSITHNQRITNISTTQIHKNNNITTPPTPTASPQKITISKKITETFSSFNNTTGKTKTKQKHS